LQRNTSGTAEIRAGTLVAHVPTRHRHWRRVGSRAAADGDQKSVDRERLLLPCLPPPAVRVTVTCKTQKKRKQPSLLVLFFLDPVPSGLSRLSRSGFFFFKWPVAGPWSCLSVGAG